MKKGFSVLITAILAAIILAGGYFIWTKKIQVPVQTTVVPMVSQEIQSQPQQQDETAERKIYTNTKYGFEFKYPANLTVEDITNQFSGVESDNPDGVLKLKVYDKNYKTLPGASGQTVRDGQENIDLSVYKKSQTRLDSIKKQILAGEPVNKINLWNEQNINISGTITKLYKLWSGLAGNYYDSYFSSDDYIFDLSSFQGDLLEKFLKAFKFISINSDSTTINIEENWLAVDLLKFGYAKNNNGIYFQTISGSPYYWEKIKGADPATFQILNSCVSIEKSQAYYSKDKNNVYCGTSIIGGADPYTFEYIGQYDDNPNGLPTSSGIGKDKKCIYRRNIKIIDSTGSCINPTNCNSASLVSSPSNCGIYGPWGEFQNP